MKITNTASLDSAKKSITGLLAALLLVCATSAQATAPRVAAKLFGDEKNADIVGYQIAATDAKAKPLSELGIAIVTEAFKAAGKAPIIDVLPSKQLAIYALTNNDAVALMGSPQDLNAKEQKQNRSVVFFVNGAGPNETLVALIFGNKKPQSKALYSAFNEGMKKLIKSGKYINILSSFGFKDAEQADALKRLKSNNPSWK